RAPDDSPADDDEGSPVGRLSDLDDQHRGGSTRSQHRYVVTDALAQQRLANRRLERDPALAGLRLRRADDGEGLVTVVVMDLDGRANLDDTLDVFALDDAGVADQLLEQEDAALDEPLLILGVVVFGVF